MSRGKAEIEEEGEVGEGGLGTTSKGCKRVVSRSKGSETCRGSSGFEGAWSSTDGDNWKGGDEGSRREEAVMIGLGGVTTDDGRVEQVTDLMKGVWEDEEEVVKEDDNEGKEVGEEESKEGRCNCPRACVC